VTRLPIVRRQSDHDRVTWCERARVYNELGVEGLHAEAEVTTHLAITLVLGGFEVIC